MYTIYVYETINRSMYAFKLLIIAIFGTVSTSDFNYSDIFCVNHV